MATIKAYTDIEQSRKLAEILPLESADMQWFLEEDYGIVQIKEGVQDWGGDCTIPCWSLDALLGILPKIQGSKPVIALDDNYITYPHVSDLHTKTDNLLIDACYEMILKLHELNLL